MCRQFSVVIRALAPFLQPAVAEKPSGLGGAATAIFVKLETEKERGVMGYEFSGQNPEPA